MHNKLCKPIKYIIFYHLYFNKKKENEIKTLFSAGLIENPLLSAGGNRLLMLQIIAGQFLILFFTRSVSDVRCPLSFVRCPMP